MQSLIDFVLLLSDFHPSWSSLSLTLDVRLKFLSTTLAARLYEGLLRFAFVKGAQIAHVAAYSNSAGRKVQECLDFVLGSREYHLLS